MANTNIPAERNIAAKDIDEDLINRIRAYHDPRDPCKQADLAKINLRHAFELIEAEDDKKLDDNKKQELKSLLKKLYCKALCYFKKDKAIKANPVYHHTQVLYNMVRLALGEECGYEELKNLLVLALLHDIGNAFCRYEKVNTDKIVDAFKIANTAENEEERKRLKEEAIELARKGIAFRLEHMDKGSELIKKVIGECKCVENGLLEEYDIHLICRAVVIHDYPSIEESLRELRENEIKVRYDRGAFLLPFNDPAIGRLVAFLREADRLFMLSLQGVIKGLKGKEVDAGAVAEYGRGNINRHKAEYRLYSVANKDDGRFIKNESLYTSYTAYTIFDEAKRKYKYP